MSTLCDSPSAPNRTTTRFDARRLKVLLSRLADAWKRWEQERADRHLDRWHRRTREERERFLSRATDQYELERLEQSWERRRADLWRVY